MQPIITSQLIIREFSILDASFAFKLMNTPSWIQYIGDRNVKSISAASNYIQSKIIKSYRTNGYGLYHVALKHNNNSIGICGLVKREGLAFPDLGFAILPPFEKKGYTTEAATAILQFAQDTLQLNRVDAITTKENKASISVIEKLGMEFLCNTILPENDTVFMQFCKKLP